MRFMLRGLFAITLLDALRLQRGLADLTAADPSAPAAFASVPPGGIADLAPSRTARFQHPRQRFRR
jgi:hypothetical protein